MYNCTLKKTVVLLLFIIYNLVTFGQSKNYFVSTSGNNANDGLSVSSSWKTIDKVNLFPFQPGDTIHFEGGASFNGTIQFNQNHSGLANKPIVITSFGSEKATILGGFGNGIEIFDAEYVEVRNISVKGDGVYKNDGQGIHVHTQRSDKMLHGIVIDNVEVSGFYWGGIGVGAEATKGFYNLRITNSKVFENGFVGIQTWGAWNDALGMTAFNHVGLYIGYTKAYNNHGISTYTGDWSGSGILMAGVENGLIEYCEAYDNGKDNGCNTGGPVGIWLANAKNCTIQYSESYNNKAGKSKDGGGFDIDGGSQNCIIQYCYSHDNEGAGYALFEWGNNSPFTGNTIRYNISQNDARKNSYGALTFWGSDRYHKIMNSHVYNNTVYVSKVGLINGIPSAVKFMGTNMKDLKIRNNIFYVTEGVRMIHSSSYFDTTVAHFQNNNYYDTTGLPSFYFQYNYPSLSSWKNAAPGQEMRSNLSLGYSNNPLFVNPGGAKTIKPAEGGELTYLTAYMVQPTSPVIDAGLSLQSISNIDVGNVDFYRNSLKDIKLFDIGANEFNAQKFMILPLNVTNYNAKVLNKKLYVEWLMQPNAELKQLELQISDDGKNFVTLKTYRNTTDITAGWYKEATDYKVNGTVFCRLKATSNDNSQLYSSILSVTNKTSEKTFSIYPNPVKGNLTVSMPTGEMNYLVIKNVLGKRIYEKKITTIQESIFINTDFLIPGYYFLEIKATNKNQVNTIPFIKQ